MGDVVLPLPFALYRSPLTSIHFFLEAFPTSRHKISLTPVCTFLDILLILTDRLSDIYMADKVKVKTYSNLTDIAGEGNNTARYLTQNLHPFTPEV